MATTFWLPPWPTMSTWAPGADAFGALRALGRFARSTMVLLWSVWLGVLGYSGERELVLLAASALRDVMDAINSRTR